MKRMILAAAVAFVLYPFVAAHASGLSLGRDANTRSLSFYNTHTNEDLSVTYWRDGVYDPAALEAINRHMRDHRSGHVHEISYDLMNLLHDIKLELRARHPGTPVVFHVISGYRAPQTNAAMRAGGGGQAKNSRHMHGDAIDIRVPGIDTAQIRDIAWCLQRGGVGYYSGSDFVHVDTHKVRHWKWKPSPGLCSGNRPNS